MLASPSKLYEAPPAFPAAKLKFCGAAKKQREKKARETNLKLTASILIFALDTNVVLQDVLSKAHHFLRFIVLQECMRRRRKQMRRRRDSNSAGTRAAERGRRATESNLQQFHGVNASALLESKKVRIVASGVQSGSPGLENVAHGFEKNLGVG